MKRITIGKCLIWAMFILTVSMGTCDDAIKVLDDPSQYSCVKNENIAKDRFEEVFQIKDSSGNNFAIKLETWNRQNEEYKRTVKQFELIEKLDHPNILKHITAKEKEIDGDKVYFAILMEYLPGEELFKKVRRNGEKEENDETGETIFKRTPLPDDTIRFILLYILRGLQYLKYKELVHMNIKLENIVMRGGQNINPIDCQKKDMEVPILIDFGLTNKVGDKIISRSGTPAYADPQYWKSNSEVKYSYTMDVYSTGVLLYVIAHAGEFPLYCDNEGKIESVETIHEYIINYHVDFGIAFLITNMIAKEPKDRMPVEDLIWYLVALIRKGSSISTGSVKIDEKSVFLHFSSENVKITKEQFKAVYGFNKESTPEEIDQILKPKLECQDPKYWMYPEENETQNGQAVNEKHKDRSLIIDKKMKMQEKIGLDEKSLSGIFREEGRNGYEKVQKLIGGRILKEKEHLDESKKKKVLI